MGELTRVQNDADVKNVLALMKAVHGCAVNTRSLAAVLRSGPALVSEQNGELVGAAFGRQFGPDVLELSGLLVHPQYRGRGIGPQLLQAWEDHVRQLGWQAIVLADLNRCTRKLYRDHGYAPVLAADDTQVWGKTIARPRLAWENAPS